MTATPIPKPCTQDEMRSLLCRRWWQCSGEFVFSTPDSVGVEFHTDGHWNLLKLDSGGAVVAETGANHEGTWDMDSSSSCDIAVNIHKGGTVFSYPIFAKHPGRVNLNTGGDGGAPEYVAIP